jgi:hypothetical protein
VQLLARNVDEQPPGLVISNRVLHGVKMQGAEPRSRAAAAGQPDQTFPNLGRHVGVDVIGESAEAPHEGAGTDPLEIIDRPGPVEAAAGGGHDHRGFTHPARQCRAVDAVDGGLFPVGDHHVVADHIDRLETEKLVRGGMDDADARLPYLARAQPHRRYDEDHVAVLCRQP